MDSTVEGREKIPPSSFITARPPGIPPAGAACSAGHLLTIWSTDHLRDHVLSSPLDGALKCQDLGAAIPPVFFRYHRDLGCEGCSYSLDYKMMVIAVLVTYSIFDSCFDP